MDSNYLLIGLAAAAVLAVIAFFVFRRPTPPPSELPKAEPKVEQIEAETETVEIPIPPPAPVAPKRKPLSDSLFRTRESLFGRLQKWASRSAASAIEDKEWEEMEEVLLEGDVGIHTTTLLLNRVRDKLKTISKDGAPPLKEVLQEQGTSLFSAEGYGAPDVAALPRPYVISIVGVNGAGKTTTIGKLTKFFSDRGLSVIVGAADTFRAAAIDQLKVWSERTGSDFVTGREGGDPGAVAFDAVSAGKARNKDVVLIDTAGRLHTKTNLMEELKKVNRVMAKVIPEAPHETWLVIDGTAGQNAVHQAREFQKALSLTGLVVTKLDGTAKGGALLAIASEIGIPVKFIGLGESAEDLVPFEPKPFVDAILG